MRPWVVISIVLLIVILGPFFLFEESITSLFQRFVTPNASAPTIAALIILLLTLDVFLPVPSSIVSTAGGALLGFAMGVVVSTAGMTLGCVLAYGVSRRFGPPLVRLLVSEREWHEVSAQFRRGAEWSLAVMRPVPVLAEASALIAGVARVPFVRYLMITALANAGISIVYSAVGANALRTGSFLLAFAGAVALPGCAMLMRRVLRGRNRVRSASPATVDSAGSR